jgi:uncharacterized membrane protein YuzA (DUF378 family)
MTSKKTNYLKVVDIITGVLLIIGGINWGLVGFFGIDIVSTIFGSMSIGSRIVYGLIGICALYEAAMAKNIWRRWECSGFADRTGHPAT